MIQFNKYYIEAVNNGVLDNLFKDSSIADEQEKTRCEVLNVESVKRGVLR